MFTTAERQMVVVLFAFSFPKFFQEDAELQFYDYN